MGFPALGIVKKRWCEYWCADALWIPAFSVCVCARAHAPISEIAGHYGSYVLIFLNNYYAVLHKGNTISYSWWQCAHGHFTK